MGNDDDPPPLDEVPGGDLDPHDGDEIKHFEELKEEFKPLIELIWEVLGDMVEKVVVSSRKAALPCRDSSWASYLGPNKTMEVNPGHSIMLALKKMALADTPDKTVKHMSWLLYHRNIDTSLHTSGFNFDVPTQFEGRMKLGPIIDDDDVGEGFGDDDGPSPLEEVAVERGLALDDGGDVQPEESMMEFEPLTKLIKEVLGDRVETVVVSARKAVAPCVLTTALQGGSNNTRAV